jgi:hypothetical protein
VFLQHGGRDDRGGRRSGERLALVIHEEAPVGVTVEGQADMGSGLQNPAPQGEQVLRLDGVGRVVREGPVQFPVHDVEMEGQAGEDRGHDQAAHSVSGVSHHSERAESVQVDERAHLGRVVAQHVSPADATQRRPLSRTRG